MLPTSMTLSELECHFCCLESYSSMNTVRISLITLCVYMDGEVSVVFNRNCFPKLKDFSRLGPLQAVMYTVKLVVSKKWHEIDTLLVHTIRKYYMTYLFVPAYGDRSFAVSGPLGWNSLPVALRSSDVTEETFRRHLKTFLFNCLDN